MFTWCGIHVTYWFACTAGFDQLLPTKWVISREAFDEVESGRNYGMELAAHDLYDQNNTFAVAAFDIVELHCGKLDARHARLAFIPYWRFWIRDSSSNYASDLGAMLRKELGIIQQQSPH